MKQREIVEEKRIFSIKKSAEFRSRHFCTWEELISINGILPTDIVHEISYIEHDETLPFGMEPIDEEVTYYTPSVIIIRPRPETDDEYLGRMKTEGAWEKTKEANERLEYLRLKAKYE